MIVAVDGGQSATRVRTDASEAILEGPGVSRRGGGAVEELGAVVTHMLRAAGIVAPSIVVVGATAAPSAGASAERLGEIIGHAVEAAEVWIVDDSVTGHVAAVGEPGGVSLIVGTGIACLAREGALRARVFDGYGYLLGDDGSAWWVGRRAVRAVLLAEAGRERPTALVDRARRRFGSVDELHIRIHDSERPVDMVAQFARDVLDAADDADPVSLRILGEAAEALRDTVVAARAWLGVPELPTAAGGRLLERGLLRGLLDAALAQEGVVLHDALASPLEGALRLAQHCPPVLRSHVHVWRRDEEIR